MNLIKYKGSKARIAKRIIELMPDHKAYGEPCCGAANILLSKPPCKYEYLNDLYNHLVRLYEVLQSPLKTGRLIRRLMFTPYARKTLDAAVRAVGSSDDVEHAWGFYCSAWLQRPGGEGFYATLRKVTGPSDATNFSKRRQELSAISERLSNVIIESKDACSAIRQFDRPGLLHFVDPDYPGKSGYAHTVDSDALIETLNSARGLWMLCSYEECLSTYDGLKYVHKEQLKNICFNSKKHRDEIVLMNFRPDGLLFVRPSDQ